SQSRSYSSLRCRLDRRTNALVGSTAADISGHRFIDLLIGGLLLAVQQSHGLHDLPGLAIAALRHVHLHPRLLNQMQSLITETFDRCDLCAGQLPHGDDAGTNHLTVLVNGTGATKRYAATEFGSCEP